MNPARIAVLAVSAVLLAPISVRTQASAPIHTWLDRYLAGQFDQVVADLGGDVDFDALLKGLRADGNAWADRAPVSDRARRQLAAATFALEAARIGEWRQWKHRELPPPYAPPGEILRWDPPALLLEWGCELIRREPPARPIERMWQLAALAVAQRAEDFEFLRSDGVRNLYNPQAEIDHLDHVRRRFPDEPRFQLAEAILKEASVLPAAPGTYTFEQLKNDPDVGPEATLRLGVQATRRGDDEAAIALFEEVERGTRDPWLIYNALFNRGRALERRRRLPQAEQVYRRALVVLPRVQSASTALAALLFKADRRREADAIIEAMMSARPPVPDPWRTYRDADDRFWPTLITRLRAEIRR